MMGIQLMVIAGLFIAAANLFFRKSIDAGGTTKVYITIQLFLTFLVAILLGPVRTSNYAWSPCMAGFGLAGGIVMAGLMATLGRALEKGPAGLTFAILNASTVMPMIVMVLLFGTQFGYTYTLTNGIGSAIVIAGLFWAGWNTIRSGKNTVWFAFALAAFLLHTVVLVLMQWRALFIHFPGVDGLFLSFNSDDAVSQWFMPMMFLSAMAIQLLVYVLSLKRLPNKYEVRYGIFGGLGQGIGTFFMIRATEVSTAMEHAMVFPIFAVTIIILCNLWGQWLYREKVNWKASILCVLGILIGTIDWSVLLQ
jgi:hypothetical protein